jgi:nitrite reductase (NO-forming)
MLWPVVLRVRIAAGTATALRWCLWLAGPGLAVAAAGMLAGVRLVAVAGLAGYLAGVVVAARPLLAAARTRAPHSGAGWQLAAATCWLAVGVLADAVIVAVTPDGEALHERLELLGPVLLVGVIGQVLLGSLVHLLPMATGGGPAAVRAAAYTMERGWQVRLAAVNLAVPLVSLPGLPGLVRPVGWWLVAAAAIDVVARAGWLAAGPALGRLTDQRRTGVGVATGAGAGVLLTVVAVLVAGAGVAPAGVAVTGSGVQEVTVELVGMRVRPAVLSVAEGVHLRLTVVNRDTQPHDLRLDSGLATAMLDRGEQATLDIGPVTGALAGWCTVAGHRAAGMSLRIEPGAVEPDGHDHDHGDGDGPASADLPAGSLDLAAPFGSGFTPYPAEAPPPAGGTLHEVELRVVEQDLEVAPGVRQRRWTFNGTAPGPVLRGAVGDVFEVTLVNDGTLGHGIDFHASALAPQGPMRVLAPGERLVYRFRAEQAGSWLYHCSAPPLLQHVGNGMYGAVVIDPPDLSPVDREYVLVAGELHLGEPGSPEQVATLRAGTPDAWTFNGTAAGYAQAPLAARVGERVRVWVLAAGPSDGVAFHVVGTRFDTVYKEGSWLLRPGDGGAQALDLAVSQGGFVELTFPEPGDYPFLDHSLRRGEGGAAGTFTVTG